MFRGQSPCLVASVTQALTQGWSKIAAGGAGRRAGQPALPLALLCGPRVAFVAEQAPLVRNRDCSQPPSPSVPFLPEVGVQGEGETELSPGSTPGPTCCHSLPVLIWLCPLPWTLGGAAGEDSTWRQLCLPPGVLLAAVLGVGRLCRGRGAWRSSLHCSVAGAPPRCLQRSRLGVSPQHVRTDRFLSALSADVGAWGTDPISVSPYWAQSLARGGRASVNMH